MQEIRLRQQTWTFDPAKALGPAGGFGAVFAGNAEDGASVAVKRIHLAAGTRAARELELADYLTGHEFRHVIPIFDAGFDAGTAHHYIVMARADMSLQDTIDRSAPLPEADAIEIMDAIAAGLEEIGNIVHRDLKPGNVLLHNGVWKLADLGLARFVEDATSLQTMKGFLSPPYASPEQWRGDRATKTADVYAVGCILYALMTGKPPFMGPTSPDYQYQHLNEPPPELTGSVALRRLGSACLAKSPLARPSVENLRAQLRSARDSRLRQPGISKLAQVSADLERRRAAVEAAQYKKETSAAARKEAADAAVQLFMPIMHELTSFIQAVAPNAKVEQSQTGVTIEIADTRLDCAVDFPLFTERPLDFKKWDVLSGVFVGITYPGHPSPNRSANLWFADLDGNGAYRWWEVGYTLPAAAPAWLREARSWAAWEPFGLMAVSRHGYRDFKLDLLGRGWYALAHNPRPVDGEASQDFCERWAEWFAKLIELRFDFPKPAMPEEPLKPEFKIAF